MPPKAADTGPPVPTDIPGILGVLASSQESPDRVADTLGALFTLDTAALPKTPEEAAELVSKVQSLAQNAHSGVRTQALKVLARLACINTPARDCVTTEAVAKDVWALFEDFSASWDEYQAVLAERAAAAKADSANAGGKKPAAPAAKGAPGAGDADADAGLPGPSKQALDAALRILCAIATSDTPGTTAANLGWLLTDGNSLESLTRLVVHHSPRVAHRSAQLVALLAAQGVEWVEGLVAGGAVVHLVKALGTSPSGAVRQTVLQALNALLQRGGVAHTELLGCKDAAAQLLSLAAGSTAVSLSTDSAGSALSTSRPTTPSDPKSAKGAPPTDNIPEQLDLSRPYPCKPAELQLAALQVLVTWSHHNQRVTELLAREGALQLLLTLLPAPSTASGQSPADVTTFASLIPLVDVADPASQQQQQQEPVQEAEGAEPSTEQEGVTEGDYSTVVATGEGSSESQQGLSAHPTAGQADSWLPHTTSPPSLATSGPLPTHETQVLALHLTAHMLTIPGVRTALYDMLVSAARAAAAAATAPAEQPDATAAAAEAAAGSAEPQKEAQQHPLDQLLHLFAGPVAAAPALAPEPSGKTAKPDAKAKAPAGKGKAEETAAPTIPAHLQPPFPAAVRGAALRALAHAATHAPIASLMARHPELARIVRECGAAAGSADDAKLPTQISTAPDAPSNQESTSSDGEQATPPKATMPRELVEGTALLLASLLAAVKHDTQQGDTEAATQGPASEVLLSQADCITVAKTLAQQAELLQSSETGEGAGKDSSSAYVARAAVSALVLQLPEDAFVAPARPPLPSPPPTPPPLPLATSLFLWDALERPMMTDGKAKLEYVA